MSSSIFDYGKFIHLNFEKIEKIEEGKKNIKITTQQYIIFGSIVNRAKETMNLIKFSIRKEFQKSHDVIATWDSDLSQFSNGEEPIFLKQKRREKEKKEV